MGSILKCQAVFDPSRIYAT